LPGKQAFAAVILEGQVLVAAVDQPIKQYDQMAFKRRTRQVIAHDANPEKRDRFVIAAVFGRLDALRFIVTLDTNANFLYGLWKRVTNQIPESYREVRAMCPLRARQGTTFKTFCYLFDFSEASIDLDCWLCADCTHTIFTIISN